MDVVERLTLEAVETHSLIAVEHLHRYELAAELCAGKRVADVGCGSGYGSRILREVCPVVTGVDKDQSTIELAKKTVGRGTDIGFEVADAHEFLRRDLGSEFDAIVMFEALEHLAHPEHALASLHEHARRGMSIVVSVPNSKWLEDDNPHHLTSFGFEEVINTFDAFEDCTLVYQFLAEGSLIRGQDGTGSTGRLVATERGEPEYANHFIACINLSAAIERIPDWAQMHLEAAPLHNRYVRNLEQANRELRRANARLGRERLGRADSAAATILGQLELERRALQEQRVRESYDPENPTERQAHLARIEELHEHALDLERQLRTINSTRAWRLATSYWSLRDALKRALHLGREDESG
jgi:2-polyprenyl-3-methyl-5-hydroxy-6-metoxy-1,4-benzoquinol methylase/Skp family chaperone for outer membrane proteins